MRERQKCLEGIEDCLNQYAMTGKRHWIQLAKDYGTMSKWWKRKIDKNGYRLLDKIYSVCQKN